MVSEVWLCPDLALLLSHDSEGLDRFGLGFFNKQGSLILAWQNSQGRNCILMDALIWLQCRFIVAIVFQHALVF